MTEGERAAAIEDIKQVKARYFRCVDSSDNKLVSTFLADDCILDYRGCCTDPVTGTDYMPAMNVLLEGRDSWVSDAFRKLGIVTAHQGHQCEITITGETTATGIWSFTDRFFMPPGSSFSRLSGYGYYHETYEKIGEEWKLKTTRVDRIKVEVR